MLDIIKHKDFINKYSINLDFYEWLESKGKKIFEKIGFLKVHISKGSGRLCGLPYNGSNWPEKYMDVDQHPHMGLSTLTFMLEGEIIHEDSLGTYQRIKPGSVNWMTAGKGVTHTERTPKDMRNGHTFTAHGYQIWVALPKALEDMEPQFHNR